MSAQRLCQFVKTRIPLLGESVTTDVVNTRGSPMGQNGRSRLGQIAGVPDFIGQTIPFLCLHPRLLHLLPQASHPGRDRL